MSARGGGGGACRLQCDARALLPSHRQHCRPAVPEARTPSRAKGDGSRAPPEKVPRCPRETQTSGPHCGGGVGSPPPPHSATHGPCTARGTRGARRRDPGRRGVPCTAAFPDTPPPPTRVMALPRPPPRQRACRAAPSALFRSRCPVLGPQRGLRAPLPAAPGAHHVLLQRRVHPQRRRPYLRWYAIVRGKWDVASGNQRQGGS